MEEQFEDIFGYKHIITKEIARGGQGVVYRTQNLNIAIKLELDQNMEIVKDISHNQKYDNIRMLPIPGNINLTLPQATLSGVSGYVMTLLDDMGSFEKCFGYFPNRKFDYTNKWLDKLKEDFGDDCIAIIEMLRQYIESGGRRERLKAYFKCACILSRLHANGLVYCDFSPMNSFYSNKSNGSIVWLIDADNLNFQKETLCNAYFTPGYGAPEVLKGKGCSFYSDSYAFAISLFWQLTWTHPFKGILTEEDFDDDFLDSSDEKAYSGELPWICDKEDDSNYKETSIAQENVVSSRLIKLFDRTFCEKGKKKRSTRPTMFEWAYTISKDLDTSVKCDYCQMDYDATENDKCPWCDTKNSILNLNTFSKREMDKSNLVWIYKNEIVEGEFINITIRVLRGFRVLEQDMTAFSIKKISRGLIIKNLNEKYDFSIEYNGKNSDIYGEAEIPMNCFIKCINKSDGKVTWIEVNVI